MSSLISLTSSILLLSTVLNASISFLMFSVTYFGSHSRVSSILFSSSLNMPVFTVSLDSFSRVSILSSSSLYAPSESSLGSSMGFRPPARAARSASFFSMNAIFFLMSCTSSTGNCPLNCLSSSSASGAMPIFAALSSISPIWDFMESSSFFISSSFSRSSAAPLASLASLGSLSWTMSLP